MGNGGDLKAFFKDCRDIKVVKVIRVVKVFNVVLRGDFGGYLLLLRCKNRGKK